jgi:ABC-type sulfate/molybdate transport systems ATPase subunit
MAALEAKLVGRVGSLAVDVELRAETTLLLVGPNGAGKTTVLRMLLGAHPVDEGRIAIGGRVLFDPAGNVDLPTEQRDLGYVPQGSGLFPHLSVVDNVGFGLGLGHGRAKPRLDDATRRTLALETLARLGIEGLEQRMPSTLSGGERQRVALARALVTKPRALLFDEPFSALDRKARRSLRALLVDHVRELAIPFVVVTHDPEDVDALEGRVVFLEGGHVVYDGSASGLRHARSRAVADFLGLE